MQPARADAEANPRRAAGELVFVADCGGTKTAAWLVESLEHESYRILGKASSSAGNPLSVGFENAMQALEQARCETQAQAQIGGGKQVDRAILSIAGAANPGIAARFIDWARQTKLAQQVAIVSDVLPILVAGSSDCVGVALISGTGSSAFGRSADGRSNRCGGWGYLLGDEGSGYAIGRAALQLTLRSLEAEEPRRGLVGAILCELGATSITELTRAVYGSVDPRRRVAALASLVSESADIDDPDASKILAGAAAELAKLAARTATSVGIAGGAFTIAASGGVLINSKRLQDQLIVELENLHIEFALKIVREPLAGCIRLAEPRFAEGLVTWNAT
jgi:N-acetylglucosamine kinase-like BadF-type ATPase